MTFASQLSNGTAAVSHANPACAAGHFDLCYQTVVIGDHRSGTNSMRLRVYDSFHEDCQLRANWDRLIVPSPMQSFAWLSEWWDIYGGEGASLALVVVEADDGTWMAVAPLYYNHRAFLNELRLLGDGRVCSDYAMILFDRDCSEGMRDAATESLTQWCFQQLAAGDLQLAFESLYVDTFPAVRFLESLNENVDLEVTSVDAPGSCVVPLPATWEEYLTQVSKNHRKRCKKWKSRELDSGRIQTRTVSSGSARVDILQALDSVHDIHNERRNEIGEAGVFEDPDFLEFHSRVLPQLVADDQAELRFLSDGQQDIACEYILKTQSTRFAYQSGLTKQGMMQSAGNLAVLDAIYACVQDGIAQFDFLRGTESYKFHWGAVHQPAIDVYARKKCAKSKILNGVERTLYASRKLCQIK